MNAFLMFPALGFGLLGAHMVTVAHDIACRHKQKMWACAKPELGGATLAFALAIVCAIGAAPWWSA